MKKYISSLFDLILGRTKKAKIINYSLAGVLTIYIILIAFPNFLFGYSLKSQNFNVYSTKPLQYIQLLTILEQARGNLSVSEIYDSTITHDIYLCNDYTLYAFLAPLSRHAFACNYPLINNIFVAKIDLNKNEAYINQNEGQSTRKLHELIAHETTHTLIEKQIGFWKYRTMPVWKNEGYAEYIGYNRLKAWMEAREYLALNRKEDHPEALYRKYHYAVTYLKEVEKMSFDEIITTDFSFEEVLNKIESTTFNEAVIIKAKHYQKEKKY